MHLQHQVLKDETLKFYVRFSIILSAVIELSNIPRLGTPSWLVRGLVKFVPAVAWCLPPLPQLA